MEQTRLRGAHRPRPLDFCPPAWPLAWPLASASLVSSLGRRRLDAPLLTSLVGQEVVVSQEDHAAEGGTLARLVAHVHPRDTHAARLLPLGLGLRPSSRSARLALLHLHARALDTAAGSRTTRRRTRARAAGERARGDGGSEHSTTAAVESGAVDAAEAARRPRRAQRRRARVRPCQRHRRPEEAARCSWVRGEG